MFHLRPDLRYCSPRACFGVQTAAYLLQAVRAADREEPTYEMSGVQVQNIRVKFQHQQSHFGSCGVLSDAEERCGEEGRGN